VHAIVLPLLGLERLKQREIFFPQHAKLPPRSMGVALVVISADYPFILVVSNDR
jgi:hypothetical protein